MNHYTDIVQMYYIKGETYDMIRLECLYIEGNENFATSGEHLLFFVSFL